jgi:hypothetical protein
MAVTDAGGLRMAPAVTADRVARHEAPALPGFAWLDGTEGAAHGRFSLGVWQAVVAAFQGIAWPPRQPMSRTCRREGPGAQPILLPAEHAPAQPPRERRCDRGLARIGADGCQDSQPSLVLD